MDFVTHQHRVIHEMGTVQVTGYFKNSLESMIEMEQILINGFKIMENHIEKGSWLSRHQTGDININQEDS